MNPIVHIGIISKGENPTKFLWYSFESNVPLRSIELKKFSTNCNPTTLRPSVGVLEQLMLFILPLMASCLASPFPIKTMAWQDGSSPIPSIPIQSLHTAPRLRPRETLL
jgi:hypothetical protein